MTLSDEAWTRLNYLDECVKKLQQENVLLRAENSSLLRGLSEVITLREAVVLLLQNENVQTWPTEDNDWSRYRKSLGEEFNEMGLRLGAFRPSGAEVNR
jgi:hypothetical protein